MKVKSSGREGFKPYTPKSKPVAQLMPQAAAASPAGEEPAAAPDIASELTAYALQRKLPPTAAAVATWDADELRGLEVGTATDALGLNRAQAARLVSKIKGLLLATEAKAPTPR